MTQFTPGLILEALLVVLLLLTVGYCVVLNAKLTRLRSSQQELRKIVSDLTQATAHAETAIRGLRVTTEEAEAKLAEKLHRAQLLTRELSGYTQKTPEGSSAGAGELLLQVRAEPQGEAATGDAPAATPARGAAQPRGDASQVDRETWRRHAISRLKQAS